MEFKIGDWVSCFYLGCEKKIKIKDIGMSCEKLYGFDIDGEVYDLELCELWQPQKGEWVCRGFGDNSFVVAKFGVAGVADKNLVEPFIGKVPSFIKG